MNTLRQAAQQALESIDWLRYHLIQHHGCLHMNPTASGIPAWLNKNEASLRTALAEPEPPPEAQTEAEKMAYCAGWWDALEKARKAEPEQEPVAWMGRRR